MNDRLTSLDECLYYLVREMGGLGIKAKEIYFEDMLEHIRKNGLKNMRLIEARAVIMAALERDRIDDLRQAVKEHDGKEE